MPPAILQMMTGPVNTSHEVLHPIALGRLSDGLPDGQQGKEVHLSHNEETVEDSNRIPWFVLSFLWTERERNLQDLVSPLDSFRRMGN